MYWKGLDNTCEMTSLIKFKDVVDMQKIIKKKKEILDKQFDEIIIKFGLDISDHPVLFRQKLKGIYTQEEINNFIKIKSRKLNTLASRISRQKKKVTTASVSTQTETEYIIMSSKLYNKKKKPKVTTVSIGVSTHDLIEKKEMGVSTKPPYRKSPYVKKISKIDRLNYIGEFKDSDNVIQNSFYNPNKVQMIESGTSPLQNLDLSFNYELNDINLNMPYSGDINGDINGDNMIDNTIDNSNNYIMGDLNSLHNQETFDFSTLDNNNTIDNTIDSNLLFEQNNNLELN